MADSEALDASLEQFRFICEHARERGYPREPWQETASLAFRLPHAEEMLLRTTAIFGRATRCAAPTSMVTGTLGRTPTSRPSSAYLLGESADCRAVVTGSNAAVHNPLVI
jgi:hypothetical protein